MVSLLFAVSSWSFSIFLIFIINLFSCHLILYLMRLHFKIFTLGIFFSSDYSSSIVDSAIARAESIPWEVALKKVEKKEKPDRVIISISFNPQVPCISSIIQKHWRTMVQDPWMKEVFQNSLMVGYLGDLLISGIKILLSVLYIVVYTAPM